MKVPELTGALSGLKVLEVGDLQRYKSAVEAGKKMGWGYYFPYLLSRNKPGRSATLLLEDEGSTCIFLWELKDSVEQLNIYLAPTPMNVPALRRCIERANDFNGNSMARVMRIDAQDAGATTDAGLRVKERRRQYVYAPSVYDDLGGKALYTVRRNVAHVEKLSTLEVLPYSTIHAGDCHALLARWKSAYRAVHGTAGGTATSRAAIELAGALPKSDLRGEVVFLDGRLVAFAFGGAIRPGLAGSFERKCDTGVRGLSFFHLRSFLRSLQEFELVNDGSDTGRTGLRQLKESFRPVEMHIEYRASQRNRKTRRMRS